MRPKFFTLRNLLLFLVAAGLVGGLAYWASLGFPLPGNSVPSTAEKVAFVSERDGRTDVYLADVKGGGTEVALTVDAAAETALSWSADGQQLLFTAERNGIHQVCLMAAAPGRQVVTMTRTSSTKELPVFGHQKRLYFLDAGKIASMSAEATDALAIFPTVQQKRERLADLFAQGGITRFAVSPDGKRFAAVINQESGQALVLYVPEEDGLVYFGSAERIQAQYLSDGSLVTLFVGGGPVGEKPQMLMSAEMTKDPNFRVPPLPGAPEALKGTSLLVRYDPQFNLSAIVLPVAPSGIAIAPDARRVALWSGEKDRAGLFVLELLGADGKPVTEPGGKQLSELSCTSASWSPDGQRLAFAAGGDIYAAPVDGSAAPTNLTGGKGKSRNPVWSPATPPK